MLKNRITAVCMIAVFIISLCAGVFAETDPGEVAIEDAGEVDALISEFAEEISAAVEDHSREDKGEKVPIDQCEHEFWLQPLFKATCVKTGLAMRWCYHCNYSATIVLAKDPDVHEHLSGVMTSPATCSAPGFQYRVCSDCGAQAGITETAPIDPEAHVSDGTYRPVIPATCRSGGTEGLLCSLCGEYYDERETPADPEAHVADEDAEWTVLSEPTCSSAGERVKYCIYDGETAVSEEIPVDPDAHKMSRKFTVDRPATCSETGSKSRHCVYCGHREDVTEIPKDPDAHAYSGKFFTDVPATCSGEGEQSRHCVYCGARSEIKAIPADPDAHTYGEPVIDRAATCAEEGSLHYVCTLCGAESLPEAIPTAGHNFSSFEIISVSEDGKTELCEYTCSVCGEKERRIRAVGDESIAPEPKLTKDSSYRVDTENCVITGVLPGTEALDFLMNFSNLSSFRLSRGDGSSFGTFSDPVCTGYIITGTNDEGITAVYSIAVNCDVNGDGEVTAADARLALRRSADLEELEGAYLVAADADLDGEISASDARKILRRSAGL